MHDHSELMAHLSALESLLGDPRPKATLREAITVITAQADEIRRLQTENDLLNGAGIDATKAILEFHNEKLKATAKFERLQILLQDLVKSLEGADMAFSPRGYEEALKNAGTELLRLKLEKLERR